MTDRSSTTDRSSILDRSSTTDRSSILDRSSTTDRSSILDQSSTTDRSSILDPPSLSIAIARRHAARASRVALASRVAHSRRVKGSLLSAPSRRHRERQRTERRGAASRPSRSLAHEPSTHASRCRLTAPPPLRAAPPPLRARVSCRRAMAFPRRAAAAPKPRPRDGALAHAAVRDDALQRSVRRARVLDRGLHHEPRGRVTSTAVSRRSVSIERARCGWLVGAAR